VRRVTAADGTSIAYEVFGRSQGTPVVMLQGLGTDSRGWALQRFAFGRRHRCYAVDNRGVGGSAGAPRPFSLEQMADDAIAVLDAEGVERAHVMGASMGGVIAQMLAVRHPARVRSLVLACTSCRHHEWRRELFQEWADEVEARGMGALGGDGLVWLVGPRLHRRFGLWINLLARIVLQGSPENFVAQVRAILDASDEVRYELARIAVPTLVITGSQDLLTPLGDAEELAELIPDARLRELRGAAHGLMVEQPNAFNGAVLRFLDEVDEAGASTAGGDAGSGSGVADAPSAAAVDEAFNQTA
jgi:3-oxoadipate enol-lactonase